jgi:hypothetical protein
MRGTNHGMTEWKMFYYSLIDLELVHEVLDSIINIF